ncbi:uroporphyrinogen-III synthase [Hephaestia sp. GCM10023244]|uniref:uroporphyrinogen-III synthase n=1 Tax=unclassified Hephaestia TaxID=2631281 RepID=UPI0020779B57|nr:uroporphyrinogen-III synthase [Hephaestia sp. MAHUQ-44]MCM8731492.1 uroporphyrinogen-III synthase [Hephaestia sp. MAHUQ-44]
MTRKIAVLRPEPANATTAAAIEALGLAALRLPLFEVRAIGWTAPDPHAFDALVLTSANAVRLGGTDLDRFKALPVHAVGAATAAAAAQAGFSVVAVGDSDGVTLIADAARAGVARALHLGGRERKLQAGGPIATAITVYASDPLAIAAEALTRLEGTVTLVHSPNAARRLDRLTGHIDRESVRIAALSPAVADALGTGWGRIEAVAIPIDAELLALARTLAD